MHPQALRSLRVVTCRAFALWGAVCVTLWGWGCRRNFDPLNGGAPTQRFVAIGAVRSVQVEEQQELRAVLGAAGIKVFFDGSKKFDIYVAESQVDHAMGLLRTNRLVLEKKVSLSRVK